MATRKKKTTVDGLARLLDEMLTETGRALTAIERRRADEALGVRGLLKKRTPKRAR